MTLGGTLLFRASTRPTSSNLRTQGWRNADSSFITNSTIGWPPYMILQMSIRSNILNTIIKFFDNSFLGIHSLLVLHQHHQYLTRLNKMSQTEVSPIARTTTYFLPVNISSVTSPNSSEVEVAVNTSWEPVTSPPASSAMTIPAHTSQGQQPISLHAAVSSNREQLDMGGETYQ